MKTIKYLFTLLFVSVCTVQNVWADDVIANVSLKEKNSLSTEILAIEGIDDIKTVTHLTVTTQEGVQLGTEDWTTMKSMSALVELDLSNASADAVPGNQFKDACPNLTIAKLPRSLTSIGEQAFYGRNNLVTVIVPNTVTDIGMYAFSGCSNLENCDISGCNLITIPNGCFSYCSKLNSFTIPSSVTSIEYEAFYNCSNFTSPLPAGIQCIGQSAFYSALMQDVDVVIPEGLYINNGIFEYTNIRSIELPTTCIRDNYTYSGCNNLQRVILKSPTVVENPSFISNASNVTLEVPSHLIASYKSHPEWSQYKDAIAISPAVSEYTVSTDLNLSNSSMRMEGTPSVYFSENASLTIAGSAAQTFNNFKAAAIPNYNIFTKVYNEEADVTVSGEYQQHIYISFAH